MSNFARTSVFSFLLPALSCPTVIAQKIEPDHDGPYVFWHDSSKATVFYLCHGEYYGQEFENFDTLRFQRFCEEEALWHRLPATGHRIEPHVVDNASKLFSVSDIHGEYEELVKLLKASGVLDADLHWAWGDGHLIFDGDVFDRGDAVTETLWMIYRLEQEAKSVGGRVHYLLGNHDMMVLRDDHRYVNEKYMEGTARKTGIRHQDLYGPDMELGRWLRTKHTMMVINGMLFVHGGVSPEMIERGLTVEIVNKQAREFMDLRSSQVRFSAEPKFLFGSLGPFWYRGLVTEIEGSYERLTREQVREILQHYGVSAIVVGHSETEQVQSHYGGLVYSTNVAYYEPDKLQGLQWEDGRFYRVTITGERQELN